jgi:hypothetical protein
MNLPPQQIKQARVTLRVVQVMLIIILMAAIWPSDHFPLWQKAIVTVLGLYLLLPRLREYIAKSKRK